MRTTDLIDPGALEIATALNRVASAIESHTKLQASESEAWRKLIDAIAAEQTCRIVGALKDMIP